VSRSLVIYREEKEVGPYLAALAAARVETVQASASERPRLREFQGLVLTGGDDVDPAQYGESRHPKTEEPDPERDNLERELLAEALELDLPVLAICRGLQLLNVFHGGDLIQHLDVVERHQQSKGDRARPAHEILIEPGSLLYCRCANVAGKFAPSSGRAAGWSRARRFCRRCPGPNDRGLGTAG
jgi:gamma-glutamyl-gamma-aminobutyrate hydrolase PuuD